MTQEQITQYAEDFGRWFGPILLNIVILLIVLFVGLKIINKVAEMIKARLKGKVDSSLVPFISNMVSVSLKVLLILTLASSLGFETTTLATIIGSLGVGVGLALTGSLQNFSSALMILLFKPFSVDDWITVGDLNGQVHEIRIFNTILETPDGSMHYIPNSLLTTDRVENHSQQGLRRIPFSVGISYDADIKKGRDIVEKAISGLDFVDPGKGVFVGVSELADSSVNLLALFWIKPGDYGRATTEVAQPVKEALDAGNVSIPFPQLDVHGLK